MGFYVGKYTICPMDPMGKKLFKFFPIRIFPVKFHFLPSQDVETKSEAIEKLYSISCKR